MEILDKRNFFVFGMAKSGCSAAILLARKGYSAVVYDDAAEAVEAFMSSGDIKGLEPRIRAVDSKHAGEFLERSDCLVLSPGIPLNHHLVKKAVSIGVDVIGEMELAFRFCSSRVLGVTGTNGKSTVVNILGRILKTAGYRTVVAGNVGTPFSSVVLENSPYDPVVLEISSFQLDTTVDFKVDIAVLLNVTPDHLDRYDDSFEAYTASKARILNRAGKNTFFVYNAGDDICLRIANQFDGKKVAFSSEGVLHEGVYLENETIVRKWRGNKEEVIRRSEFSPMGIHNAENAMAAVAAVIPMGIKKEAVAEALKMYHPLPHRMELVRVIGGVAYINDSKATNVDAAKKSLRSIEGKVILIIGGRDKNGDFSVLGPHLSRVKKIIAIGESAGKIEDALKEFRPVHRARSMEEAVSLARDSANPGDTVLLAPACASFDMFENYEHRGEVFRASVDALKGELS